MVYSDKLTDPVKQAVSEIKSFWPSKVDFLLKFLSSHFGRQSACHVITKSAGSKTNNKSSEISQTASDSGS